MANQEQLDLLIQGVETWNQWKTDTSEISPGFRRNLCYDADLTDADLRGIDLSGANLGKVDLARANFAGASLVGTCFAEAELAESNFAGACLNGADLSEANVCAANFSNADLRNANLSGADLSEASFQGANLSGANLSGADLSEACLLDANVSETNFSEVYSGSYLFQASFHRAEIRRAKEAGAILSQAFIERQGAKQRTMFSLKRKAQGQDIVLSTRIHGRLLRLPGLSLLFVIVGVWMLRSPGNLGQIVMATITVLFFGLGVIIFLLQFLRLMFSHTPLLIINSEGIRYFCPSFLELLEKNPMTPRSIMLKWKDIGALGFIKQEQTTFFAVYASARRWRSGWSPSILLPQSLLPVSVEQLSMLLQKYYQTQMEAYSIENVEITDTSSSSRKKRKTELCISKISIHHF